MDSTVKKSWFQGGEGGKARKVFLGKEEGSMSGWVNAKALQDDLQSLGSTLCLAKPKMEKEVGRRGTRS